MPALNLSVFLSGGAVMDLDGSFFVQLAIFWGLFFFLRSFVFKPMLALFDAREAAIDGAKHEAKRLETLAESKLRDFEAEMKKIKVEATVERDSIRQDAGRLERELVSKARDESQQMQADASKAMQTEATKIRNEMKTSIPQLAGQIAEKLLGRKAA